MPRSAVPGSLVVRASVAHGDPGAPRRGRLLRALRDGREVKRRSSTSRRRARAWLRVRVDPGSLRHPQRAVHRCVDQSTSTTRAGKALDAGNAAEVAADAQPPPTITARGRRAAAVMRETVSRRARDVAATEGGIPAGLAPVNSRPLSAVCAAPLRNPPRGSRWTFEDHGRRASQRAAA